MVIIKVIAETPPEKNNIFYTRNVVQKDLLIKTLYENKNCPYSQFFWSEWGKIRTQKTLNKDTFYAVKRLQSRNMTDQ